MELSSGGARRSIGVVAAAEGLKNRKGSVQAKFMGKVEMDMFGGLKRTTSRFAIAAAAGLLVGGAMTATPAAAGGFGAGVGGDCCADLEERVAELEATTVRKGNKKVSVTLSGWVVKAMNVWDDGDLDHFIVGDKDYDLGSRFAITGTATIAPGWTAGYNHTVNTWGSTFGFFANQLDDTSIPVGPGVLGSDNSEGFGSIATLYSYGFIKSERWGAINIGHLSQASDNKAVLADLSGTVIESNAVFFEGPGFFLRPDGGGDGLGGLTVGAAATPVTATTDPVTGDVVVTPGTAPVVPVSFGSFLTCTNTLFAIGVDCFGAATPAIRYDSPTWGGFRFETSYGANNLTGFIIGNAEETDFWDIAALYSNDWGNFKVSAAYTYTWIEQGVITGEEGDLHQVGASVMHTPTGLGVYGYYQHEESDAAGIPETDAFYIKPFLKRNWTSWGATTLFGEYAEYDDQFVTLAGVNVCTTGLNLSGTNIGDFCGPMATPLGSVFVDSSEVERWGLGISQDIDAAALHLFARWQHQELDVDFTGFDAVSGDDSRVSQGFEDFDVFQVGGVIAF